MATETFAEQQERMRVTAEQAAENERKRLGAAKEDEKRRSDKRAEMNLRAAKVMEESQPTPTQAENDLAKLGALHPDDKVDPKNPEMPTLYDQQRELEGNASAPYRTREAVPAPKPVKKPE